MKLRLIFLVFLGPGICNLGSARPILGGFLQPRFGYEFAQDPVNTFSVQRAGFSLDGQLFSFVNGRIAADLTLAEPLMDAYIELGIPKLEFQIGQFTVPQGLERLTPVTELELIEYSLTTSNLTALRDMGLQLGLYTARFEIALGLFNGAGRNAKDENDQKDGVARLLLKPFRFMNLGGSYYRGKIGPSRAMLDRQRFGAEFDLKFEKLSLKGEFMRGVNGATELQGFYLQPAYRLWPQVQPVLRYERFDPNLDLQDDGMEIITIGLNLLPIGHKLKLQLNYLLKEEEGPPISNDELLVQFQLKL